MVRLFSSIQGEDIVVYKNQIRLSYAKSLNLVGRKGTIDLLNPLCNNKLSIVITGVAPPFDPYFYEFTNCSINEKGIVTINGTI